MTTPKRRGYFFIFLKRMYNLKITHLEKFFNQSVFEGVNMSFSAKKGVVAVIGDNGSGKSTLLKMIAGEDGDFSGEITWQGSPSIGVMPQELPDSQLSGGQKKMERLSQLLFGYYDVLVLDEPDNHLDIDNKLWLEEAMADFPGLILLISHDRQFLRKVSTHVWLVENKNVRQFNYGFAKYEELAALEMEQSEELYRRQKREEKRLEELVKRFGYIASYNSERVGAYHSMEKRLARHRGEMLEDPKSKKATIKLSRVNVGGQIKGKTALLVRDLKFWYRGTTIFKEANLHLFVGDKVGVSSPNGTGKSTLIKLLLGESKPVAGVAKIGENLLVGYYSQEHVTALPLEETPIKLFLEKYPMNPHLAEQILKRYMFSVQVQKTKVRLLSGGQKSRLQLMLFLQAEPDILILDEPTNHLDLKTITVLEEFLRSYKGSVLLVSHDRQMLTSVCDRIYTIREGEIREVME